MNTTFNNKAFSMLELLLVIAIIGILGLMSTGYTARFYSQTAVTNTTDQLKSYFRKAQIYSMMGKQSGGTWGVRYTPGPQKRITLFLQGTSTFDEHYSIDDVISMSGFTEITFDPITGQSSDTATITVTDSVKTEELSINAQGVVNSN